LSIRRKIHEKVTLIFTAAYDAIESCQLRHYTRDE